MGPGSLASPTSRNSFYDTFIVPATLLVAGARPELFLEPCFLPRDSPQQVSSKKVSGPPDGTPNEQYGAELSLTTGVHDPARALVPRLAGGDPGRDDRRRADRRGPPRSEPARAP